MLSSKHGVKLWDCRQKKLTEIYQPKEKGTTIFSGIPLLNETSDVVKSGFILGDSFRLGVFDNRKSNEPVFTMPHFSEESPPSILQLSSRPFK